MTPSNTSLESIADTINVFHEPTAGYDVNLRRHTAMQSYWDRSVGVLRNHPPTNAFDRDTTTYAHTYFKINNGEYITLEDKYLDNGYEWLAVELKENKFQMVGAVQLMKRTGE